MLKEKRKKFFVTNIVIASIFLLIGGGFFFFNLTNTSPAKLEKEGAVFKGEKTKNDPTEVLVDVYWITPEPVADIDNKTQLWVAQYDKGFFALQASPDDKDIARLIKKGKSLADKPEKLVGKYFDAHYSSNKTIKDYANFMQGLLKDLKADEELTRNFSYYSYVSLSEYKSGQLTTTIAAGVFSLLAAFFVFNAFYTQKKSNKAYEELYQNYPELNGSLEQLAHVASYQDPQLKIYIYKNHLMVDYSSFLILDLREVKQLYHHLLRVRGSRNSSLIARLKNGKTKNLPFKNIGKATDEQVNEVFNYLYQHFPDIYLGV
ncbi:hypothetical protein [Streptococcus oricebi]|uniref:Uncharacterized protein n=1 Tax=Streptococcus oricebi TaxID=1547447 RepID=A0ABS5B1E4_9STRE|nr:hypothetical protein [Streptococcus oricebi]MBP2622652.1 hypothetical protein [Streptococcus oricebi]